MVRVRRPIRPVLAILPRQGEVAPKATEGADTKQQLLLPPPPSGYACHLPLAGEDRNASAPRQDDGIFRPNPFKNPAPPFDM